MRISQVAATVDEASGSILLQVEQNTRTFAALRFSDDDTDAPLDLSAWSFDIAGEAADARVEASSVTGIRLLAPQPTFALPTVARTTELGRIDLRVPQDIFPGDIGLDALTIPVVVCYLRLTMGVGDAPIEMMRVLVAVRRGKPDAA